MSDDVDELFDQASGSTRHETEPETESSPEVTDLQRAIAEAFHELEHTRKSNALHARDDKLAALLAGADKAGRLEITAERLADEVGRSVEDPTQSDVIRLAIRYALEDADPELMDEASIGYRKYLESEFQPF